MPRGRPFGPCGIREGAPFGTPGMSVRGTDVSGGSSPGCAPAVTVSVVTRTFRPSSPPSSAAMRSQQLAQVPQEPPHPTPCGRRRVATGSPTPAPPAGVACIVGRPATVDGAVVVRPGP